MASNIPSQVRTVDPFASYNSNTVNKLTRMLTFDDDLLATTNSLRVSVDSTSPNDVVVVSTGQVYKDDTLIEITDEIRVDFQDEDFYYQWDQPGLGFNEIGWYYVVLRYRYVKSRPAPQASIQIIKPSQRSSFSLGGDWVFLAAVQSEVSGPTIILNGNISDYDPENIDNKRRYLLRYAGSETFLPVHETTRDQARIAYDVTTDQFWFGFEDRWEQLNVAGTYNIDTTATNVGDLCYVDSNGEAAPAIVTAYNTGAEMVAVEIGVAALGTGQTRLSGYVEDVNVESTSPAVLTGDLLYLSDSEAGTVTSTQTSPLYQVVGRAVSDEVGSKIDILFFARDVLETSNASVLNVAITAPGDWTLDTGSYKYEIDITDLDVLNNNVIVSCKDQSTGYVITPQDVDLSTSGILRIWMPVNTVSLWVTVVG